MSSVRTDRRHRRQAGLDNARSDLVSTETLKVIVLDQTEKAIKVQAHGTQEWLPRSQIEKMSTKGDRADITIPYWLFKEKFGD